MIFIIPFMRIGLNSDAHFVLTIHKREQLFALADFYC